MSSTMTWRVVIAQSVLTETYVQAPDREVAETRAAEHYVEPTGPFTADRWLSDAWEIIEITEATRPFTFDWTEAFDKFGFGDGDDDVRTDEVVDRLTSHGYVVEAHVWGLHNCIVTSIKRDGIEQIPATANVGYDDPRDYLPPAIIALLDGTIDGTQVTS